MQLIKASFPAAVQPGCIINYTLCVAAAVRGAGPGTTGDAGAAATLLLVDVLTVWIPTANDDGIQPVLHVDILGSLSVNSAVVSQL